MIKVKILVEYFINSNLIYYVGGNSTKSTFKEIINFKLFSNVDQERNLYSLLKEIDSLYLGPQKNSIFSF
ncbi:hypothetical protein HMPREF1983_00774 [Gemella bergeri ATCC 700627]|uniref:Uncharacterized protein n=1 Tax=Gemella bergeri ATCC 700627 TaxID=1321820 RepID=U2S6S3_9BACL|nr:hypothetical protein HMPREF1983_00774 [Gemella bergeri ATCC 700627]